jgi:hypothetical protein
MKILGRIFFYLFVAIILSLATGCEDTRVAPLEQRVGELEVKVKALEADRAKAADENSQKESAFRTCIQNATDEYSEEVKANGTRTKNGTYNRRL